jgi:SAM-dependent methyltransferase
MMTLPETTLARPAYRATHCLLCRSNRLELVLPLARSAVGNEYLHAPRPQPKFARSLWLCRECGNVQIEDVVHPDLLFRSYTYATGHSLGLVEHFRGYAREVAEDAGTSPGALVVDVGSNDGSLLRAFQESGYRVVGVDPAVEIAGRASDAGVPTLPEYFTPELADEIREEYGPASVVTANNVFAHSDRLPEMAEGVRRLLAPDGVFVFEVSYLLDIVQKMLWDTVYHEHLFYHSVRSLRGLFGRTGLELIGVRRIASKGGSLRGTVQRAGGPRPADHEVARLAGWEEVLSLHHPETFARLGRRIQSAKEDFVGLIDRLRAQGKRVAGYGASPTVTSLVSEFELAGRVDFLVDDNAVKQHTYSPGDHIPVYPSAALYEREADVAAILAWNYAGPIAARHARFTERGGRFVIPLPSLRVP